MARLNELKDQEALDRLADMLDPLARILANEEVKAAAKKTRLHAIKTALKVCGGDVMEALAIYDGVPKSEFHCSAMGAITRILSIFKDPDMASVFQFSEQKEEN